MAVASLKPCLRVGTWPRTRFAAIRLRLVATKSITVLSEKFSSQRRLALLAIVSQRSKICANHSGYGLDLAFTHEERGVLPGRGSLKRR